MSLAQTSLAYRHAMAVGFVGGGLLDPETVDLCRGSPPKKEAAPSRDARMEASAVGCFHGGMGWSGSVMETTRRHSGRVGGYEIEERDARMRLKWTGTIWAPIGREDVQGTG